MKFNKITLMTTGVLIIAIVSQTTAQDKKPFTTDSLSKSIEALNHDLGWVKNLKVTGWVQAQFQVAEAPGAATYDGGNFLPDQYNRFEIRRGRVKFTYSQKLSQYVLQLNATERGVNLVEIFGKVTDPWTKSLSLTAGVMNRPFGFEIQQSSADRETPERSRYVQILLPNERDLGAMLTFQPTKGKKLYGLKIDAGLFSGNGIYVPGTTNTGSTGSTVAAGLVDTDQFKDFMGRIHYKVASKEDKVTLGIGGSIYNGGIAYQNNKVYETIDIEANGMKYWRISDTTAAKFKGEKAPRQYYAGEFQLSVKSVLGTTTLRGEYMTGTQSGALDQSKSPNVTTVNSSNTCSRQFAGGNAYFVQRLGKTKHEVVLKYEWYDPNTKLNASDFGNGTSFKSSELRYDMLGLGYVYYWDTNVKFMIYYNLVQNEKGAGISGYTKDLHDNVFTARLQYRF